MPTDRKTVIVGSRRTQSGKIRREICEPGGIEVVEGHGMGDPGHLCLSIPPTDSGAHAVGRRTGKSAIRIHRACLGRAQHVTGFHVWAKGYGVSPVGFDEQQVLAYIREQAEHENTEEQLTRLLTHKPPKEQEGPGGSFLRQGGPGGPPDTNSPPRGGFLKPPRMGVVADGYI